MDDLIEGPEGPRSNAIPQTQRRALLAGIGGIAAGAFLGSRAEAGPLTPPPGPPAPTARPLGEIEPRILIGPDTTPGSATAVHRITAPGSYYLGGIVEGESGKDGIAIESDDVSIDLNGFALQGVPGSGAGIRAVGVRSGLSICNGVVRGWGQQGIAFHDPPVDDCRIEAVSAIGNEASGFNLGNASVLRGCAAVANVEVGFFCEGSGMVAVDCAARLNGSSGFVGGEACVLSRCASIGNGFDGFIVPTGGAAAHCAARGNQAMGFRMGNQASVEACTANFNTAGGIRTGNNSRVCGNTCGNNSGEGILLAGVGNLVDGNTCTQNAVGIGAQFGANFITCNICRQNTTNWSIASGSACLVVQATTSGAINGNSGGVSPGSANPNANYTIA